MHRPSAGLLEEFAEEVTIEAGEDEPLRAPRRAGHDVDILGAEALLADKLVGVSAGEQRECVHSCMVAPMSAEAQGFSELDCFRL